VKEKRETGGHARRREHVLIEQKIATLEKLENNGSARSKKSERTSLNRKAKGLQERINGGVFSGERTPEWNERGKTSILTLA